MNQSTHEVRVKEWSALIRECNASGLNKNQWCELNNVNEKQFYYWQRVVRRETLDKVQLPESVDHPVELSDTASASFIHQLVGTLAHAE